MKTEGQNVRRVLPDTLSSVLLGRIGERLIPGERAGTMLGTVVVVLGQQGAGVDTVDDSAGRG